MRQAFILSLAIIASFYSSGKSAFYSNSHGLAAKSFNDSASVGIPNMRDMLYEIVNVAGIEPDFILKEAKVLNLQASISRRKKMILYNPEFINNINALTRDKWSAYALLAHEIGHHLKGHTKGKKGNRQVFELEADEFAGSVLYKLGASLEQAQEVMFYIAKTEASKYYPNRDARMKAIERGWSNAKF